MYVYYTMLIFIINSNYNCCQAMLPYAKIEANPFTKDLYHDKNVKKQKHKNMYLPPTLSSNLLEFPKYMDILFNSI